MVGSSSAPAGSSTQNRQTRNGTAEASLADRTSPTVERYTIKHDPWDESALLDIRKNNYSKWSRKIKLCLTITISDVESYLDGTLLIPDSNTEPRAYANYLSNDRSIAAFLKYKCADNEQTLVDDLTTSHEVWTFLKDRHLKQGTIHRVLLEDDYLNLRFSNEPGADIMQQWWELEELHKRICAMGQIDDLSHLMIGALSASRDIPSIRDYIANALATETPDQRFTRKGVEDRIKLHMQLNSENAIAMAATTGAKANNNSKYRAKPCTNCNKLGHSSEYCVHPGGGMAGKTIEEANKARDAANGRKRKRGNHVHSSLPSNAAPSNAANVCHDASGRAYIIDQATQKAFLLQQPIVPSVPNANQNIPLYQSNHNGLANVMRTDPVESILGPTARIDEYHSWLAATDLTTSCDWRKQTRDAPLNAMSASLTDHRARLHPLDFSALPFYLDSGASAHISPERSDFSELYPITPRKVQGVGGSCIYATGIGRVKLVIGKGKSLILDNVLFIPASNVRLLSISSLIRSLQCQITFKADFSVTIRNQSGAHIASGSLTSRNLYKLDCSRTYTEHSILYSAPADIETWHRRLGHAHHDAIQIMANKQLAEGSQPCSKREGKWKGDQKVGHCLDRSYWA